MFAKRNFVLRRASAYRLWSSAVLLGMFALSSLARAGVAPAPQPAPQAEPRAEPQPFDIGLTVNGRITTSNPRANGNYYQDYVLLLGPGERVQIDMEAIEPTLRFDTYLQVLGRTGEVLQSNDDRGDGSLNSRLILAPDAPGRYIVPGDLRRAFSPASPVANMNGNPARIAEYLIQGEAGDRVRLEVRSENADIRTQLYDSEGRLLAAEEGISGFVNPTIAVILPRRETYRLNLAVGSDQVGEYVLAFQKAAAPVAPEGAILLPRNQTVAGALTLDSGVLMVTGDTFRLQSFYRLYSLRVSAGETLTVTMTSSAFAPAIDVGVDSGLGFAAATSSEESGGPTTRLVVRPSRSGPIQLRARSVGLGLGAFTIRVDPSEPSPAAAR